MANDAVYFLLAISLVVSYLLIFCSVERPRRRSNREVEQEVEQIVQEGLDNMAVLERQAIETIDTIHKRSA